MIGGEDLYPKTGSEFDIQRVSQAKVGTACPSTGSQLGDGMASNRDCGQRGQGDVDLGRGRLPGALELAKRGEHLGIHVRRCVQDSAGKPGLRRDGVIGTREQVDQNRGIDDHDFGGRFSHPRRQAPCGRRQAPRGRHDGRPCHAEQAAHPTTNSWHDAAVRRRSRPASARRCSGPRPSPARPTRRERRRSTLPYTQCTHSPVCFDRGAPTQVTVAPANHHRPLRGSDDRLQDLRQLFAQRRSCHSRPATPAALPDRRRGRLPAGNQGRREDRNLLPPRTGRPRLHPPVELATADYSRMAELVEQYHDPPLGTSDASVIALAERLDVDEVATLDLRLSVPAED